MWQDFLDTTTSKEIYLIYTFFDPIVVLYPMITFNKIVVFPSI